MLKNKSRLLILFMIAILLFATFSFATDTTTPPEEDAPKATEGTTVAPTATPDTTPDGTTPDDDSTTTPNENIENYSLTVFEDDYTMDRLIDGNVYIFANNVTVSGQVNGNVIVFANNVTFTETAYVANSIYVAANKVNYSGVCVDLNIVANTVNMTYSDQTSFAFRDMNVMANIFNFAGGVGRNANVYANKFNFTTEENKSGIIYGNLNYSSLTQLELKEGLVEGSVNYKKISEKDVDSVQDIILDKLLSLGTTLVYTAIIFLLTMLIAPKFANNSTNKLSKLLPAIGIGALALIAIPLIFIALMFTVVGVSFGFVLIGIYALLFFIYSSITNIYIANTLRNKFKADKMSKFLLVLLATTIVIWALQQIPYVGPFITLLVILAGAGLMVMGMFRNGKKNLKEASSTSQAE